MKRPLIIFSLLIVTIFANAKEADLYTYKSTEGYCAAETLAIKAGQELQNINTIPDFIVIEAQQRAVEFYRAYSNPYTACEGNPNAPQTCPLNIRTKFVFAESDLVWTSFYGIIVKVDMGADEDRVEFYFKYDDYNKKLFLVSAFHSEQCPAVFWICEN